MMLKLSPGALCGFGLMLAGLSWPAASASAGGVADVVVDLYGGDGILLAPTPPPFPSHAPHFTATSLRGLNNLNTALTANTGQFAFNSTVTGFKFDIERGVPVRTIESLAPIVAERAETLGKDRLTFGLSYTHISFESFEGTDLEDLSLALTHDDVNGDGVLGPAGTPFGFELDRIIVDIDLELEQDILAGYATYGITDSWDVGIIVPFIRSKAEAVATARIERNSANSAIVHNFDPSQGDSSRSSVDRTATGIGDIILRTKYNFLQETSERPALSGVARLKLPTGRESDLHGTGETDLLGLLVASKKFGSTTPHLNLGYEASTDSELSNVRYIVGLDHAISPQFTVATELLGRWEPNGDGIGDHIVDLALGFKWNPVGDFVVLTNLQIPVNKGEGLRSDVIWTIGGELPF